VSKKFGWVDYANLGAQIAQARAQSATHQELMQQTRLMQSESQRKNTVIQAKQYLVQCENSFNKSSMIFEKYPYYTILRLEYIAEEFRGSNLQSLFTEIQDLRIANEFQINVDNKIRDLRKEDSVLEEKLSELRDNMVGMERIGEAYNCIIQNEGLKDTEPKYNSIRNYLTENNKKRKRLLTIAVSIVLILSYTTGLFPNTVRGTSEWNGCDVTEDGFYDCDEYGQTEYFLGSLSSYIDPDDDWNDWNDYGAHWIFQINVINFNDGSEITEYRYGKTYPKEWSNGRCAYIAFTNAEGQSGSIFPLRNPSSSDTYCNEEAPLMLIIPEFTVLFLFGLFYLLSRRVFRLKMPLEIEEQMATKLRNDIIIEKTISSYENVSSDDEIVNNYNYYSENISKNFPTENTYLI